MLIALNPSITLRDMASMVAKACSSTSCQVPSSSITVQEKSSRNKRKFRADPPPSDPNKTLILPQNQFTNYEFSAEKFDIIPNGCDMCCSTLNQDHPDALKLDLGLSCAIGSSEVGPSRPTDEIESTEEFHDADWSDLTESQLEELALSNLDAIFKTAIKKIVTLGYTEEASTKAVLRSGLCYGCKDTVSNIVENTLSFIRNGKENSPRSEHCFEDLQEMERYILAELVCVLREIRPFFSTGDAMWCLLICDMNVSQACAMDSDPLSDLIGDGLSNLSSSVSNEAKGSEINLQTQCKNPNSSVECGHSSSSDPVSMASIPCLKPKNSSSDKDFGFLQEEKLGASRKISGISKREYVLRQKSLDKHYRTYGSKGSSRTGKISSFGGLLLDKKNKSLPNAPLKISKAVETSSGLECVNTNSTLPKATETETETDLTLSLATTCNGESPSCGHTGIPYDRSSGKWVPQDSKDEIILKLVPRVRELQNELGEWTEWANQKVMQAARRLGKDKAELKTLRQEREEVERLKREKQSLEENTMKKLTEMENALCKASGQVERANTAVRRLEVENAGLRREMEAARLRAVEAATSCEEVSRRERRTLVQFQSWEKQKTFFLEELLAEKRKLGQLQRDLEQAKGLRDQLEARWKQEEKAKEELLKEAKSLKKEREKLESSAKSKEGMMRLQAENNLQKFKEDVKNLEREISRLRLTTDSSKISAMKKGNNNNVPSSYRKPSSYNIISDIYCCGVKRERECVMCLSEEMSVVFLPCAHQVVCMNCNELHEKQGMKDCPSCRSMIQRRISVRYARS